jgi:hypothetical protein
MIYSSTKRGRLLMANMMRDGNLHGARQIDDIQTEERQADDT